MIKRLFLLFTCCLCGTIAFAQLPYAEVLEYNKKQLTAVGFRYNKKKRQYTLNQQNKQNKTSNIFNIIGGNISGIRPHPNDQYVLRQNNEDGAAKLVFVVFYDNKKYDRILQWIKDEQIEYSGSAREGITQIAFHYNDLHIELTSEFVMMNEGSVKAFKEKDLQEEEYHIYTYTILVEN